jgi:integrase
MVAVKYLKQDGRNGHWVYRRRVPKVLRGTITKTEFVKTLGRTQADALAAYGAHHRKIEHLVALARDGMTGLSPREQQRRVAAVLEGWGLDPSSSGRDDNEETGRGVIADAMLEPYRDARTGEYEGVPADVSATVRALYSGVGEGQPRATITDAFAFYLTERAKPIPEQRDKQVQRFRRAERRLIHAVGADKAVADMTRGDARAWRDMRAAAGVSAATLRREKNDISAVIALAISELDAGTHNPFAGLSLPEADRGRKDERDPLPPDVINDVYAALGRARGRLDADLLRIWTILDFTGARPGEVRQLVGTEAVLDGPVPHIVVEQREGRTLKTAASARRVPVLGPALEALRAAKGELPAPGAALFPQFANPGGMDRLSQALRRRVREFTPDRRHTPYSLRHNMADRLRAAEAPEDLRKAILGHSEGNSEAARYGGDDFLERKRDALARALAGYRGMPRERL